jgi:hypothetical protein
MQVRGQRCAGHAERICDRCRTVDTVADVIDMQERAAIAFSILAPGRHQAFDMGTADGLAFDARVGRERARHQPPARHGEEHLVDGHAGHLLGLHDGCARRLLGAVVIDDHARLQAA